MAKTAILAVRITGDSKDAQRALSDLDTQTATVGRGFDKLVGPAKIAGAAVAGGLAFATAAAVEQQDQLGALSAVYGPLTKAMTENAHAASEIGLSTSDYARQAALLGNTLIGLGASQNQAAAQADELIYTGAALAAQFGGSSTDAVDSLTAAFRGEYDSLQKFIPSISAATVEQRALADTGKKTADALTAQEKATATYELVTEGATGATGAFSEQQKGAAFQLQQAKAAATDAAAELGTALLPALGMVTDAVKSGADWIKKHEDATLAIIATFGVMAAAVLAVNASIAAFNAIMAISKAIMAAFKIAQLVYITMGYLMGTAGWAALGPLILIPLAIAAVIAIIYVVVRNWDTLVSAFKTGATWMKNVFVAVWDAVASAIGKVVGWFKSAYDWIKKILNSGIGKIASILPGGKSASTALMAVPSVATRGVSTTTPGGNVININVSGALDEEATARKIRDLLRRSDIRLGIVR